MNQRRELFQAKQRRAPWRASVAAAVGVAAIAAWVMLYCAAQANYVPLETAYQAHLDTLNNPPILQDPPAPVARAEFFVGAVLVLAVPVVVIAPSASSVGRSLQWAPLARSPRYSAASSAPSAPYSMR